MPSKIKSYKRFKFDQSLLQEYRFRKHYGTLNVAVTFRLLLGSPIIPSCSSGSVMCGVETGTDHLGFFLGEEDNVRGNQIWHVWQVFSTDFVAVAKKKIFYRLFRWFIPDVISYMLVNISVGKLSLRND